MPAKRWFGEWMFGLIEKAHRCPIHDWGIDCAYQWNEKGGKYELDNAYFEVFVYGINGEIVKFIRAEGDTVDEAENLAYDAFLNHFHQIRARQADIEIACWNMLHSRQEKEWDEVKNEVENHIESKINEHRERN